MNAIQPLVVTIKDAAKLTSLSIPTLYRMFDRDELETVKVGKRRLVKVASIHQLLGMQL
ncbi:helix-turn-helix domain-containing protein [uncultured Parasphingorhabdus sp.]|uniref:helix-turn-helix domain-containing protein n=1 Tax=uncultured Parasphingorhabdus sp. TaxID=2709694 RepID=UPI002AA7A736|nr:helix-turn-helix domain-containing protein [uncultured Parasphingorhabdus sp.]